MNKPIGSMLTMLTKIDSRMQEMCVPGLRFKGYSSDFLGKILES